MLGSLGEFLVDLLLFDGGNSAGHALSERRRRLTRVQMRRRLAIHSALFVVASASVIGSIAAADWSGALYVFLIGLALAVFSLGAVLEFRRLLAASSTRSSNER